MRRNRQHSSTRRRKAQTRVDWSAVWFWSTEIIGALMVAAIPLLVLFLAVLFGD